MAQAGTQIVRCGAPLAVALLVLFGFACGDDDEPETRADSGTQRDASVSSPSTADSGSGHSHARDSGTPQARDAAMSLPDASMSLPDSGPEPRDSCDSKHCPVPSTPLRLDDGGPPVDWTSAACCAGEQGTECGLNYPEADSQWDCFPVVPGKIDETCLDTVVDGQVIQGCRRPDGKCGHLTPGWGCHRVYRRYWGNYETDNDYLDSANPPLPNPFNCTNWLQPCTRSLECCSDGTNNVGVCWVDSDQDLDAGGEDGGTLRAHCNSFEERGGTNGVSLDW